jgi:hypothetical protein
MHRKWDPTIFVSTSVADLRGFADFAGNGGAVAAGLFRMNVDEGERLLSRILRPGARG